LGDGQGEWRGVSRLSRKAFVAILRVVLSQRWEVTMAERKSPAGAADFVAKIVKDPKNPPDTLMLTGYLGASSESAHTRLYFDPTLNAYVEIPNDAILHTEPVAEDGLGASYVWIKRDAVLTHGPAAAQRAKGTFLEGPIMQAHLGAAEAGMAPGAVAMAPSVLVACQSWICPPTPRCPTVHHCPPTTNCPPTPHCPPSVVPQLCQFTPALPCFTPQCTQPPQCASMPVGCVTVGGCPVASVRCPPTPLCPPMSDFVACVTVGGCPVASVRCPPTPLCPPMSDFVACVTVGGCPLDPNPGAAAARLAPTFGPCPTAPVNCNTIPPSFAGPCLTHQPHCVSALIPCLTHQFPCPTRQCTFVCP
jgi:hypothetical protein